MIYSRTAELTAWRKTTLVRTYVWKIKTVGISVMLNYPAALTNVLVKPSVPLVVKVSFRFPISQKGQYPQYYLGCDSAYCNCRDGDNNVDYLECKEMVHLHHFSMNVLKRTIKDLLHECLHQLFAGLPC